MHVKWLCIRTHHWRHGSILSRSEMVRGTTHRSVEDTLRIQKCNISQTETLKGAKMTLKLLFNCDVGNSVKILGMLAEDLHL